MTAALVTTYNEADTIGALVAGLKEHVDHVLVVDDPRTTDNTEAIAAAFGASTLVDIGAHGIGPCLIAGLKYLRGQRVVVIDAGGSHSPEAIPGMLRLEAWDVVIGSRFVPGAAYHGNPRRAKASRAYSRLCSRRTGHDIKDWTSGYRVYSPRAVAAILARPPAATMHGWQPQALAACLAAECVVGERPITYRAGRSSMNRKVAREAIGALRGLSCS